MFPKIYSQNFTFPGVILSDDILNNAMQNNTKSNDTITASEYECLRTHLMNLVNNKSVTRIERIKITYEIDY